MSTAPQGWQDPKITWSPSDPVGSTDRERVEGNINRIELANRTLDQGLTPTGSVGNLRQMLSWFANRIKSITGMPNWYDAPPASLKSHVGAGGSAHALATESAAGFMSAEDKSNLDSVFTDYNKWIVPGDTVILESLSVTTGTKSFRVRYPGLYRVTGEFRTNSMYPARVYIGFGHYTATILDGKGSSVAVTSATSFVPFSADLSVPIPPGGKIAVAALLDSEGSGYIRNVRIRGVFGEPPGNSVLSHG